MKKSTLFFATYLALNCSITNADTLAHFHNAREHSHSLPSNGIAHRHNGGKVGTVNGKSNLKTQLPDKK